MIVKIFIPKFSQPTFLKGVEFHAKLIFRATPTRNFQSAFLSDISEQRTLFKKLSPTFRRNLYLANTEPHFRFLTIKNPFPKR